MFKKILFATSASSVCDDAARVAFDLSNRYDAELIVFHDFGTPTRSFSQVVSDVRTGEDVEVDDNYIELVTQEVKDYYSEQMTNCAKCSVLVTVGYPHREVLRVARSEDVDLIVMGATTQSERDAVKVRRDFPGSTVQRVARAARCPVLTVSRPSASMWGGFENIVFATDFSHASDNAFQFALKTAKELDGTLYLFHAYDVSGSAQASAPTPQEEIEDALIQARNTLRQRYVNKLGDFKQFDMDVWEGIPYVEVVKYAREKQADLIVMAHHSEKHSPQADWMDVTLEKVIMRAPCPVISVNKPDKI